MSGPLPSGSTALAVGGLLLNALVWGVSWWPFKILQAQGLHPLWATALVYGLSTALIWLWLVFRPKARPATRPEPALLWLLLASGLTNVGFNWAVTVGDVVRVVLLFYLMPAWSVGLAWWVLGERPGLGALWRVGLSLAGLVILLQTPDTPWPWPHTLADGLALLGGFCFALTNALLLKFRHTPESHRMLAMFGGGALMASTVAVLASLVGLVALPFGASSWVPGWAGLAPLLWLCLSFLGGNLALQYGAARLAAHTTALVMLSEVVFAALSSQWIEATSFDGRTALGGALILLAALLALPRKERPAPLS